MMGPLLTTLAPEAAPGELFAGDAATLKSEQLPQRSSQLLSSVASFRPPILASRQARHQPGAISTRVSVGGPR
jgi:hypothetical protein